MFLVFYVLNQVYTIVLVFIESSKISFQFFQVFIYKHLSFSWDQSSFSFPFPCLRPAHRSFSFNFPQAPNHARIQFIQNRYQINLSLSYFRRNLIIINHLMHWYLQNNLCALPKRDLLTPIFCDSLNFSS